MHDSRTVACQAYLVLHLRRPRQSLCSPVLWRSKSDQPSGVDSSGSSSRLVVRPEAGLHYSPMGGWQSHGKSQQARELRTRINGLVLVLYFLFWFSLFYPGLVSPLWTLPRDCHSVTDTTDAMWSTLSPSPCGVVTQEYGVDVSLVSLLAPNNHQLVLKLHGRVEVSKVSRQTSLPGVGRPRIFRMAAIEQAYCITYIIPAILSFLVCPGIWTAAFLPRTTVNNLISDAC